MAKSRYVIDPRALPAKRTQEYDFGEEPVYDPILERPVGTRDNPAYGQLGNQVIDNIQFEPGSYTNSAGEVVSYGGLTIDSVLLRVQQSKQIIRTEVAGRQGSVKEYISDGDFDISIGGTLMSTDGTYPQDEVDRLIEILEVPANLSVVCPFLQLFGIDQVVVSNYSLQQTPGYASSQVFEISLLSDYPIELLLNDE